MTRQPLFEIRDLKKYFRAKKRGLVKAVDGVSLDIWKGETVSLVGESGCGKTTCGRTILNVYPKTGGRILYNGKEIERLSGSERKAFCKNNQMIFQDPYASLDPRMPIGATIQEGMDVHLRLSGAEKNERVREQLARVGLPAEYASRFPHELSGGQRQRVGIARALAVEPEFIVCDEPIAALDVSIQAQVVNLLIRLQNEMELTYLFISHDLSMVRHISDRIGVMYLGAIVELAGTEDLYRNPCHPYTKALFSAIPRPDPDYGWSTSRIKLEGEVPNPTDPPPGCKFHERCAHAREICTQQAPLLKEVEPSHFVACHLL